MQKKKKFDMVIFFYVHLTFLIHFSYAEDFLIQINKEKINYKFKSTTKYTHTHIKIAKAKIETDLGEENQNTQQIFSLNYFFFIEFV